MRITPLFVVMSITELPVEVTSPLPSEAMGIYNAVQEFLTTLHEILQSGAMKIDSFDPEGAQKIRDFEYNWLSLFGFYKGITPIISDFYFNYYKNEEFEAINGPFVSSLSKLIQLLIRNASDDVICDQIHHLVRGCLDQPLFKSGVIHDMLTDLDSIVHPRANCKVMIQEVKRNGGHIIEFLHFIQTGTPPGASKSPNSSSEEL